MTKLILSSNSLRAIFLITIIAVNAACEKPAPSVESGPKIAKDQEPAFEGQTRISGIKTEGEFTFKILTDKLTLPWGLAFLPDVKMIVSERKGTIRIISPDGTVGDSLLNVPPVRYEVVSGLTDIKVAPDFATSRYVFWSYLGPVHDTLGVNCVARGKLSADEKAFEDVQVIYQTSVPYRDAYHTGSRLLFDKDGNLIITIGDRYQDSIRVQAQSLKSPIGKILRIKQDGTPAQGNPFTNTEGALKEIWSLGHRNPQGLAFDPVTGELWESEHGPKSGDEINLIKPAKNYGWPIVAYGIEDSGKPVNGTGLTQQDGIEQPAYYWDPAVAPSGMTFYTGDLVPEWKNNLFVGALKGAHIMRLTVDHKSGRITGEERLLANEHQRFRNIVQGPDQALYAITDQGRLYRIGR